MKTVILWFRNDLRIHDLPALAAAADADHIVPVFIFDKPLYGGVFGSANRNTFLLESLEDLKKSLKKAGADLIIREGKPDKELPKLAKETKAKAVYYTIDYTPYAIHRDQHMKKILDTSDVEFKGYPGRLCVDSLKDIRTKSGTVVKVFTPFWRQWQGIKRRDVVETPGKLSLPNGLKIGSLPKLADLSGKDQPSPDMLKGGEAAGRKRLQEWLKHDITDYDTDHNSLGKEGTSRLSSYLHFGCLSVREIETMLPNGKGADAWHRQLAWRDFYNYILLNYPDNVDTEMQERYRTLQWSTSEKLLQAWKDGRTGYPVVDAAMRQLNKEGWMHNRGRLIVGSFLTKDLHLDWRDGQQYFMQKLIDGDHANNNGNWQWIASTGVDPAPLFRRLYNPVSQLDKYDEDGSYTRTYVPELKDVPDKYLAEPWKMSDEEQEQAHCIIGKDYPKPVVEHARERQVTLERYGSTAD